MEENVSDCNWLAQLSFQLDQIHYISLHCVRLEQTRAGKVLRAAYGIVNNSLIACIVVDVDGNATEGGNLCTQLVEAAVVLRFAVEG